MKKSKNDHAVKSKWDIEVTMNNMRELRVKAGLTQDALGAKMGVPRSYISKWERRDDNPSFENLVRLYRILHGL